MVHFSVVYGLRVFLYYLTNAKNCLGHIFLKNSAFPLADYNKTSIYGAGADKIDYLFLVKGEGDTKKFDIFDFRLLEHVPI